MSLNSEKQFSRYSSNDYWAHRMQRVINNGSIIVYDDLLEDKDYRKVFKEYFGSLDFFSQKNYLDVGVGFRNKIHNVLKDSGASIVNIDISSDVVKYWQEKGEKALLSDAFHLPSANNYFDGIICTNLINTRTIEDVFDLSELFQEFHRVIKDKGHFIQSHFGFCGSDMIVQEDQLGVLINSGFDKIQCIENQHNQNRISQHGLSFIAEKN